MLILGTSDGRLIVHCESGIRTGMACLRPVNTPRALCKPLLVAPFDRRLGLIWLTSDTSSRLLLRVVARFAD